MSGQARRTASIICVLLGALTLLAGALSLYASRYLLSSERFAAESAQALERPDVRGYVSHEITVDVIEQAAPDLIAFRPVIEAGLAAVIQSAPFEAAFRAGVARAHRAVFAGADDAVVTVANVGVMLEQAVRRFDPELARNIPADLESTVLDLSQGAVAVDAVQLADDFNRVARLLPLLAIALLVLGVAIAPERRRAVIRTGLATALVGTLLAAVAILGHVLTRALIGDPAPRDAAVEIWDVFMGGLVWWGAALAILGIVVVSAGATALRAYSLDERIAGAWARAVHEPATPGRRALWAVAAAVVGLLFVLEPDSMVALAGALVGVYLLARAAGALIGILLERFGAPGEEEGGSWLGGERRTVLALGLGSLCAIVAAALAIALIVTEDGRDARAGEGCNGSAELCDRTLDRVAFAATHNSFAGASYPGFVFPEQNGTITEQLEAGVRGLWVDTYYGIPGRRVYTDTSLIDPALNAKLQKELGPRFVDAAAEIRGQIARPAGEPRVYFCHGYCELGAVDAVDGFREVADFLSRNPREVVIIDVEDYTSPEDTVEAIRESGLEQHVYKGPIGSPWPTLGEMIDSGGRALIVNEHLRGGPHWYHFAYADVLQETPFHFSRPAQMSCEPNRGRPGNSLFLLNNWISTDPAPRPTYARRVNAYDFLLDRARRCQRQRGLFPNIINVNFYADGDVFGVVDTLNGVER